MCSHGRVVIFSICDLSRIPDIYQAGIFYVIYLSAIYYYVISTVLQFYPNVLQVYAAEIAQVPELSY
jgi:hypothetical protein